MADVVYARYSSHNQDRGTSIDVQLDTCHRAAGRACTDYIDRAKSGRAIAGRKEFLRLLADVENGRKIGRLFVYKFDRLGRNMAEIATVISDLEDAGVEVISATEGKDLLVRGVQIAVAEWYSHALGERTRDGLCQRFKEGCFTGGPVPYGYRVVESDGKRRLAVNKEEAEVVQWIVRLYLGEAIGFRKIARRLNDRGIPSRKRGTWAWSTVRNMLNNRTYVGELTFNKRDVRIDRKTGRRVHTVRKQSEWMRHRQENLRIISDEDWKAVQERLAERARGSPRARQVQAFTGLLYCQCGSAMYRKVCHSRNKKFVYYECGERHRNGTRNCSNGTYVREDLLLGRITEALMAALGQADDIIRDAVQEAKDLIDRGRSDARRLRAEIAELDGEIDGVMRPLLDDDFEQGAKRAIGRKLTELENRRDGLRKALDDLAEAAQDDTERISDAVAQALDEARQSLANVGGPAQINELVHRFVGELVAHPGGTITQKSSGDPLVLGSTTGARAVRQALCTRTGPPAPLRRTCGDQG